MVLFGEGELEPSKDNAMLLVEESCSLDLPLQLCQKLALLDFEARKDAAQVMSAPSEPCPDQNSLPASPLRAALYRQCSTCWAASPRVAHLPQRLQQCTDDLAWRVQVSGAIFRMDQKGRCPGVKYVHEKPEILFSLFRGRALPRLPSSAKARLLPTQLHAGPGRMRCGCCVLLGLEQSNLRWQAG